MVKHPDMMDDETFIAHMNLRHTPLAGMTDLTGFEPLSLLRTYHQHITHRGVEENRPVNHQHREAQ